MAICEIEPAQYHSIKSVLNAYFIETIETIGNKMICRIFGHGLPDDNNLKVKIDLNGKDYRFFDITPQRKTDNI